MNRRELLISVTAAGAASILSFIAGTRVPVSRYRWVLRKSDGGLARRDSGMGFEHNGRLWISNGYQKGNVTVRDLVTSHDGITWQVVNPATPYAGYSAISSLDGWIYVYDGTMRRSRDGVSFETVATTGNPKFEPEAPMFLYNGVLHIVRTTAVDIFDAGSGRFRTVPHPVPGNRSRSRVVFKGRIYIMAGAKNVANNPPEPAYPRFTSLNDVWSTDKPEDPSSWSKHRTPPWVQRMWPGVSVHDDYLYITGGYNNFASRNMSDTWRTSDGSHWERVETVDDYTARHAPNMFSRNGRLLLVAGNTNIDPNVQNDVWELVPV